MNKKKTAAALAAVTALIKTQEEAAAVMAMQDTTEAQEAPGIDKPKRPFNIWGVSGRQQQMVFRANMQLRIY
jgi:hypothetical protein